MGRHIPSGFAHYLRELTGLWDKDPRSDAELLVAFADNGDQVAFKALVGRHGPAIWAACRRVLHERADAEDAFQAVFIALAQKARAVRIENVGGWLARVSRRVSLDVSRAARRRSAAHRRLFERVGSRPDEPLPPDDGLHAAVREELIQLPLRFRAPLSLYYLEGETQADIGRILGMSQQTVSDRLQKGLEALRTRLVKRGMAVTAAALVAALGSEPIVRATPADLVETTLRAAVTAPAPEGPAAALAERAVRALANDSVRGRVVLYGVLSLAAIGTVVVGGVLALYPNRTSELVPPTAEPLLAPVSPAAAAPRTDRFGDPLPKGAVTRIGTVRFWLSGGAADATPVGSDRLAVVDYKNELTVIHATEGRVIAQRVGPPGARLVAGSADGRRLVVGGTNEVWGFDLSPTALTERWKWRAPEAPVNPRAERFDDLVVSSDGRTVLYRHPDGVRVLDGDTGTLVRSFAGPSHKTIVKMMAVAPSGRHAAGVFGSGAGASQQKIGVLDLRSGDQESVPVDENQSVLDFALAPAADRVAWVETRAAAGFQKVGGVRVWSLSDKREECHWSVDGALLVAFTPDGRSLAEIHPTGRIVYRDPATGKATRSTVLTTDSGSTVSPVGLAGYSNLPGIGRSLVQKRAAGDGKRIALSGPSGLQTFDVTTARVDGPDGRLYLPIRGLVFDPDGRRVITVGGSAEQTDARLWDAETGEPGRRLESGAVLPPLPFNERGSAAATPMQSRAVVEQSWSVWWKPVAGGPYRWDADHAALSNGSAVLPGGQQIVRVDGTGPDLIVADRSGREVRRLVGAKGTTVKRVVLSGDGRTVLAVTATKEQRLDAFVWDTESGRLQNPSPIPVGETASLTIALSHDGRWMASARGVGGPVAPGVRVRVTLREIASGGATGLCLPETALLPKAIAFSSDRRWLAVGQPQSGVEVWDVPAGRQVARFDGHSGFVSALAFSPNNRRLVSGGIDQTGLVWDVSGLPDLPADNRDLDTVWAALVGADPAAADRAEWALAARPAEAARLLTDRIGSGRPDRLAVSRGIAVLERIGGQGGAPILEKWARGPADEFLSAQAAQALGRLKHGPNTGRHE